MIPKIIHLTWFSGDEYPYKIQKCLDTWKEKLPDFEVKIWDMKMARDLNIPFVNEALDTRKWAFAGDVVRAYAVWQDGGVYMDTDIWVLKRFDEYMDKSLTFFMERNDAEWKSYNEPGTLDKDGNCLKKDAFIRGRQIQAAMFMGEKGTPLLKEIVDFYRDRHFLKNGEPDMSMISPSAYAKVLEKYGFLYADKEQHLSVADIYPAKYVGMSLYDHEPEAFAIHMAEHAWDPRGPWATLKFRIKMSPLYKLIKPLWERQYK